MGCSKKYLGEQSGWKVLQIHFSIQREVLLWPRTRAADTSTTMVGLWMIVIHIGYYHDKDTVTHWLPVTLARSSEKQEAVNHNTITFAENFRATSQGHSGVDGHWADCTVPPPSMPA